MRLAVLVLAACNQVFGLDPTEPKPEIVLVDAVPDAAPACPPAGVQPQFSTELKQAFSQFCTRYTISAVEVALALCRGATPAQYVYEGRLDEVMTRAKGDLGIVGSAGNSNLFTAVITPEGSEAFVGMRDQVLAVSAVWRFERDASGMWTRREQQTIPYVDGNQLSPPTRGPVRRMIVWESTTAMKEYVTVGVGAWTLAGAYTNSDIGMTTFYAPDLSPDGLRVVLSGYSAAVGENHPFYVDRGDPAARFGTATPYTYLPSVTDPFMTEDCARLYFSGLNSVFFVRQGL